MILYVPAIKELFKNEEDVLQEEKTQIGRGYIGQNGRCYHMGFGKNLNHQIFFQALNPRGTALAKLAGCSSDFLANF